MNVMMKAMKVDGLRMAARSPCPHAGALTRTEATMTLMKLTRASVASSLPNARRVFVLPTCILYSVTSADRSHLLTALNLLQEDS